MACNIVIETRLVLKHCQPAIIIKVFCTQRSLFQVNFYFILLRIELNRRFSSTW